MEIRLQNVGIVTDATVSLSGITVIAGPNKSGKSTIGRSLMTYGTLLRRMDELLRYRKLSLLWKRLGEYIGLSEFKSLIFLQMLVNDKQAAEVLFFDFWKDREKVSSLAAKLFRTFPNENTLTEKFTKLADGDISKILSEVMAQDDWELMRDIIETRFQKVFIRQINSIHRPETEAKIEIFENGLKENDLWVSFINNSLAHCSNKTSLQFPRCLYLEPIHMMDVTADALFLNRWSVINDNGEDCSWNGIMKPNFEFKEDISLTVTEKQDIKQLLDKIKNILGGELDIKDGRLLFKERAFPMRAQGVEIENLASGMKSMIVVLKALDSYALQRGMIFVIDEPESNLHPEWQVKFANVLVSLWAMLGIRVVVTTHSPYFLKALEYGAAQLNCRDVMSCYFMQPDSDAKGMVAVDVSSRLNDVYKSFFDPLNILMAGY